MHCAVVRLHHRLWQATHELRKQDGISHVPDKMCDTNRVATTATGAAASDGADADTTKPRSRRWDPSLDDIKRIEKGMRRSAMEGSDQSSTRAKLEELACGLPPQAMHTRDSLQGKDAHVIYYQHFECSCYAKGATYASMLACCCLRSDPC